MAPAEAGLFNRAAALPDVASYSMVHQLDTDISAAMSAERRSAGETPTLARLTQLKGAVKSAITDATVNHSRTRSREGWMAYSEQGPLPGMTPADKSYKPGSVLARRIQDIPIQERSAFLDSLEKEFRAAGDLEMLREIRAYRALASAAPPRKG